MQKVRKNIDFLVNHLKLLSLEVGFIMLAFLLSLAMVVLLVNDVIFLKNDGFDFKVFKWLNNYVSDGNTRLMEFVTLFGSQFFLVPAFLIMMFYFFFIKKEKWLGIRVAAVSFSSLALMFSLKYLFKRPRPAEPLLREASGLSFPSGHAFMSFSFFALLIYIIYKSKINNWFKVVSIAATFLAVFMVGLSRIYLRVHYATDVIAGFCMGFMWIIISMGVLNYVEKQKTSLPRVQ